MIDRRLVIAALATLALPTFSGCFFFDDWGYEPYDPYESSPREIPPPYNDGTLLIEGSAQFGTMGDIRGYASDAVASQASYAGTWASVRLDSLGDSWWVMNHLSFDGIDLVNTPAGTYRNGSSAIPERPVYISATGCSGPSYGNYTYDSPSSDAEVTIHDNADGSRTLDFRATFPAYDGSGEYVAEGSVTYREGEATPPPPTYGTGRITASDASQQGDMGSIAGYSAPATVTEAYYYGLDASVRLDSIGEGWWVMTYLNVSNLDLQTAPAGTYQTTSATWSGSEPYVTVTGCSGPSYGNYTFDGPSDEAEIVLSDNDDGTRTAQITATFGGQIARASFRYSASAPY